jgi:hypothetical protein
MKTTIETINGIAIGVELVYDYDESDNVMSKSLVIDVILIRFWIEW